MRQPPAQRAVSGGADDRDAVRRQKRLQIGHSSSTFRIKMTNALPRRTQTIRRGRGVIFLCVLRASSAPSAVKLFFCSAQAEAAGDDAAQHLAGAALNRQLWCD